MMPVIRRTCDPWLLIWWVGILFFAILPACTTPFEDNGSATYADTGAIYGNIVLPDSASTDYEVTVPSKGSELSIVTTGSFFIDDLRPGSYSIIAIKDGFHEAVIEDIQVGTDSISIVSGSFIPLDLLVGPSSSDSWQGIQIPYVNPDTAGCLEGSVTSSTSAQPITVGFVTIEGTFWTTKTDTSGHYKLDHILPGTYDILATGTEVSEAGAVNLYPGRVRGVQIARDTSAILDFSLRPVLIPEHPTPRDWGTNMAPPRYVADCL